LTITSPHNATSQTGYEEVVAAGVGLLPMRVVAAAGVVVAAGLAPERVKTFG